MGENATRADPSRDELPPVLGQGAWLDGLLDRARDLELPHALLISGPPGCGKSTAARWLARALLCGGDDACGKRVVRGTHPDLRVLTVPADKVEIPIDDVRQNLAELGLQPVEGRARVVIVDPADRLNEQGQNALLKTLEEPGVDTFLLLVTARPDALLETVRSRAVPARLRPLAERDLAEVVERRARSQGEAVDGDALAWAAAVARGSAGVALALLGLGEHGDPDARVADAELARLLAELAEGRAIVPAVAVPALLAGTSGSAQSARARTVLRLLAARAREALQRHVATADPLAARAADRYGLALSMPWADVLDVVFAAEQDLEWKIAIPQVLTGLLLRLGELVGTPGRR